MPTISWDGVITAAATAALVTFAFEYLAKPRLEARKDRILDRYRVRREFVSALMRMNICAALFTVLDEADPPTYRTIAERDRQYEAMRAIAEQISDNTDRYAAVYGGRGRANAEGYATFLHMKLTVSNGSQGDRVQKVHRITQLMVRAFTPPGVFGVTACHLAHIELWGRLQAMEADGDPRKIGTP